jgi:hypothetical protein
MSAPASRASAVRSSAASSRWPLERALFFMAGTVTILSAVLAAVVSEWFLLLTVFVGLNQWLFVAVGACPASLVLSRVLGLQPACDRRSR